MNQLLSREAIKLLRSDELRCSVVITDPSQPDNPIVFVSEEFEHQTGYNAAEVIGRNCRFLQGPDTDPAKVRALREAIHAECDITLDILNYNKDGTKFWNRLRLRAVHDHRGRIQFFIGTQNPIHENQSWQLRSTGI